MIKKSALKKSSDKFVSSLRKVTNVSQLDTLLSNLKTYTDKQACFEQFVCAYLSTNSLYSIKNYYAPGRLPKTLKRQLSTRLQNNLKTIGAFETESGEIHLFCILYLRPNDHLIWKSVSAFFSGKDTFKRLLITNSSHIPNVILENQRTFYSISKSHFDKIDAASFKLIHKWLNGQKVSAQKLKPLPHQKKALQKLTTAAKKHSRMTLLMACGTGKTLVGLWYAEKSKSKTVLVLVPSLGLIHQTLNAWMKNTSWKSVAYICVCSDQSVKEGVDDILIQRSELDFPVTTDSKDIQNFMKKRDVGTKVIFATYQSADRVAKGLGRKAVDLAIFDEAHKTAGKEGKHFALALDDKNIKCQQRVFMTATPKHYRLPKGNDNQDEILAYSMDDEAQYGPVVYTMPFSKAVEEDIICDYRVIISVITNKDIDKSQIKFGKVDNKGSGQSVSAEDYANRLAMAHGLKNHRIKKAITFHARVKHAQAFTKQSLAPKGLKEFNFYHVNGAMQSGLRASTLQRFAQDEKSILTNARCLTEGVDVPVVDMVAFLSPKKSKIDIVQAAGRCMRKSNGKRCGYVFVPLYLDVGKNEKLEDAAERLEYEHIWEVLHALKEHDDALSDIISKLQVNRGSDELIALKTISKKILINSPKILSDALQKSILTRCIQIIKSPWDYRYGQLITYYEKHGNCNVPKAYTQNPQLNNWVVKQRRDYKKGTLSAAKIAKLEEIDFVWDKHEAGWSEQYNALVEYKKQFGHCHVPVEYPQNSKLGAWANTQRRNYKRMCLTKDKIALLEEIGFVWDKHEAGWSEQYNALVEYKKQCGHCDVPAKHLQNPKLGRWVYSQRQSYQKNTLSKDRISRLEKIGFSWDILEAQWLEHYDALIKYKKQHGHCNVPALYHKNKQLGSWVSKQRCNYRKSILLADKVAKLENLGFVLDVLEAQWSEHYDALIKYKKQHGHCNVPTIYPQNQQLGSWVATQRCNYRKDIIPVAKITKLEEIGFVWNKIEAGWLEQYNALVEYKKQHGHCNVPARHPQNTQLGSWVGTQRKNYKKGLFTKDKIALLEEIGFVWDRLDDEWFERYEEYKVYVKQNKHDNTSLGYSESPQLVNWVKTQRKSYKKGTLSAKRIKLLKKIKFRWRLM